VLLSDGFLISYFLPLMVASHLMPWKGDSLLGNSEQFLVN